MLDYDQASTCLHLDGCIMMLPRREVVETGVPATLAIESGIFNHPVVVLSREVYLGKVAVFVVSSPAFCATSCPGT